MELSNLLRAANAVAARRVDENPATAQIYRGMRRLLLSLLMVFAFASSGVAQAMATCPMLEHGAAQSALMVGGHNCSEAPVAPAGQPAKRVDGCAGQACQAGPAVSPAVEPAVLFVSAIMVRDSPMPEAHAISRAPNELWRPPRAI